MFSDLTLGPSFKVKRWFTGLSELSFRWIQIYIGSPIGRSRYSCIQVSLMVVDRCILLFPASGQRLWSGDCKTSSVKLFEFLHPANKFVSFLRVRNLKFPTYLKFATCGNANKINELW